MNIFLKGMYKDIKAFLISEHTVTINNFIFKFLLGMNFLDFDMLDLCLVFSVIFRGLFIGVGPNYRNFQIMISLKNFK